MRTELLGPRHPQTTASIRQLADILTGRGQPAAALPLYQQALTIQTEVLPKGHRLTLASALGLGEALTALGRRAEAARVLGDALRVAKEWRPTRRSARRSRPRSRRSRRRRTERGSPMAWSRPACVVALVSTFGRHARRPGVPAGGAGAARADAADLRVRRRRAGRHRRRRHRCGGRSSAASPPPTSRSSRTASRRRFGAFTEISLPLPRARPAGVAPRPSDVRSNRRVAEGRTYVLLLDDYFVLVGRSPAVQKVAHDFVDRYVQPGDLVAVATTSGLADGSQAFTEDMALVGAAIDRFVGKKARSATIEKIEAAYRAREQDPMRQRTHGDQHLQP